MCLTCGCGQPSNRHGSQDNLTVGDLRRSAHDTKVAPRSVRKALRSLNQTAKKRK